MKSYGVNCLLLLLLTVQWDSANGQCSLVKTTAAKCQNLEDARYIETYHLRVLKAPSKSHTLTPGNFRNLTSLLHLDLSGGNIERIESGSFAKLSSLQTLNLAENRISHLDAGAFDGLKHLHSLNLRKNQIRQLPAALMTLKDLRILDVSDNSLYCNCASMKLRDALLARGVKISKKTHCSEPVFTRHASILKPDTKIICTFEREDREMQGDQPFLESYEGSGDPEEEQAVDEELEKEVVEEEKADEKKLVEEDKPEEKEEEQTAANEVEEEEETAAPAVTEESSTASSIADDHSAEGVTSTTAAARDDITFDDTDLKKDTTTESSSSEGQGINDDLISAVTVSKEPEVTEEAAGIDATSNSGPSDDLIIQAPASEGSGDGDDDGSGVEGSGLISKMPAIDFSEDAEEAETSEEETPSTTSTTTTTTEGSSWWGFRDIISNLNPFSSSETTEAPHTTEKTAEQDLEEEQFIAVKQEEKLIEKFQDVSPKVSPKVSDENTTKKSPRTLKLPDNNVVEKFNEMNDKTVDPAMSQESRKGMGSYIVLAILLAILAILVGIAAYKGDFCRNQPKRRDVERGTEMKDMRKSLLDQNSTQPKIQASNGNTMENVPLMTSPTVPDEPRPNQRRYDITPAVVTNGANKSNGPTEVNDPVKPPRKPTHPEIEAPLNGLNPPMDDIDGPTRNSLLDGSDEILSNGDCCERPPLSPGAQRVKITLQENPDSVPKTPILITRLKGGDNLVKAP